MYLSTFIISNIGCTTCCAKYYYIRNYDYDPLVAEPLELCISKKNLLSTHMSVCITKTDHPFHLSGATRNFRRGNGDGKLYSRWSYNVNGDRTCILYNNGVPEVMLYYSTSTDVSRVGITWGGGYIRSV